MNTIRNPRPDQARQWAIKRRFLRFCARDEVFRLKFWQRQTIDCISNNDSLLKKKCSLQLRQFIFSYQNSWNNNHMHQNKYLVSMNHDNSMNNNQVFICVDFIYFVSILLLPMANYLRQNKRGENLIHENYRVICRRINDIPSIGVIHFDDYLIIRNALCIFEFLHRLFGLKQ